MPAEVNDTGRGPAVLVTLLKPTAIKPTGTGPATPLTSAVRLLPSKGSEGDVSVGAPVRQPMPKLVALAASSGAQLTMRLAEAEPLNEDGPLLLWLIVTVVPPGPTTTTALWLMDVVGLKKPPRVPDSAPETTVVLEAPEIDTVPLTEIV